jgi:hypothetical protein
MKKDINHYFLKAYISEEPNDGGLIEMEFEPYEYAVIIRDSKGNEIWTNPDRIFEMVKALKEYSKKLNQIIKLKREIKK